MTPMNDRIAPNQKKNLVNRPKNSDITAIIIDAIPIYVSPCYLVYWHIHFQTNDAEYFFIDKATERGDAVASSIEVNAVQWENRQVN